MKYSILFNLEDIAKFYYRNDIILSNRIRISKEIYNSTKSYVDKSKYKGEKHFIREVEKTLNNMIFRRQIVLDHLHIETIQDELDLDLDIDTFEASLLKTSSGEEFLKQIRLILDFDSIREFRYMKMRTLAREFGYKRRNNAFISLLKNSLDALDLYIMINGERIIDSHDLLNVDLDSNIRIYGNPV